MGQADRAGKLVVACTAVLALAGPDETVSRVRAWRVQHEPQILRELVDLVAIPNVATDTGGIARNAETLTHSFERRRFLPENLWEGIESMAALLTMP
jgi:hypothetical protein